MGKKTEDWREGVEVCDGRAFILLLVGEPASDEGPGLPLAAFLPRGAAFFFDPALLDPPISSL